MPTRELLRVGLEKGDGYRGAFGDNGEEVAPREGQEKGVGFADGCVAARLFIEERLIAEVIACMELD